jgi:hypothetical protein
VCVIGIDEKTPDESTCNLRDDVDGDLSPRELAEDSLGECDLMGGGKV